MANQAGVKRSVFISVGIVLLVAGAVIGYLVGQVSGNQTAANKYISLINAAFPAPSGTAYNLQGTVQSVYGATIAFTVNDPQDYLPHMDGSARATQTRNANTNPNTKYFAVDNARLNKDGSPTVTPSSLADIKPGAIVMVKSDQNIFSASSFDVSEVDLLK